MKEGQEQDRMAQLKAAGLYESKGRIVSGDFDPAVLKNLTDEQLEQKIEDTTRWQAIVKGRGMTPDGRPAGQDYLDAGVEELLAEQKRRHE